MNYLEQYRLWLESEYFDEDTKEELREIEKDEKDAKSTMKASQSLRSLFLFVAVVVGVVAPCFNTISVVIPMFFPRIAVAIRPYIKNKGADMNEG